MDFSSSINFDEVSDKFVVLKPRVSIRKNHLKLGFSPKHFNQDRSKSFYIGASPQNSPLIQVPVLNKPVRTSQVSNGLKPTTGFFAFEGQKVMLSSMKDLVNHEDDKSTLNILGTKNFRRFKWNHGKLRSKSSWCAQSFLLQGNNEVHKKEKKNRNNKRLAVPRTRVNAASVISKRPELRISGVMKEFVFKDFSKYKDSADLTDE